MSLMGWDKLNTCARPLSWPDGKRYSLKAGIRKGLGDTWTRTCSDDTLAHGRAHSQGHADTCAGAKIYMNVVCVHMHMVIYVYCIDVGVCVHMYTNMYSYVCVNFTHY